MSVNRVFELIRKGEMILFCGAGMSIYAGYPSGAALVKLIYDSMTAEEKENVHPYLFLPELSEEYINLKLGKRNALLKILKDVFLMTPTNDHIHQIVTRIPQIKTIITTNYDCLFENVYGEDCNVVKSSTDIAYLQKSKTEIIKIHGDLSLPDSILISKTDYTKFFDSQTQNVM